MDQAILLVVLEVFIFLLIALLVIVFMLYKKRGERNNVSVHSSIGELKAIGVLNVFKVVTKEIVTEDDHSWGDIGKKYLSFILSNKKMAMIFEFEIDFGYDLQRKDFEIVQTGLGAYLLKICLLTKPRLTCR